MRNYSIVILLLLLASCAPTPNATPTSTLTEFVPVFTFTPTPSPTLTPFPSPSKTLQPTLDFQTYDLRWCVSDSEGDVDAAYIDVVKIDAIAQGEFFTARIFVKSIPESLTFNREGIPPDHLEYSWEILIDIDGDAKIDLANYEDFADYDLSITHFVRPDDEMKTSSLPDGTQQDVWKTSLDNQTWEVVEDAKIEVDYSTGTITIAGNIPGLNAKSTIAFSTFDYNPGYQEQEDKLDSPHMVPPNTACSNCLECQGSCCFIQLEREIITCGKAVGPAASHSKW